MLDKNKTIILMDINSIEGKIVRLIVNRNFPINEGYDISQHSSESTYYPCIESKNFILVGDIFNEKFLADIKAKDENFLHLDFKENKKNHTANLLLLSNLWNQTATEYKHMSDNEVDILQRVSRIFDYESIEDPSGTVMKTYIDIFVTILTTGNEFFNTPYLTYFEMVDYYNKNQDDIKNNVSYNKYGNNPFWDLSKRESNITAVEQHFIDEKKFFEPNAYQIVLDFKGRDLEEVLLDFYKKYPDLKEHFNLIKEVEDEEDISSIMEQKLLLESLHLVNVEYYNKRIKKSVSENVVNQNILSDIISIINYVRNRLITRKNKK